MEGAQTSFIIAKFGGVVMFKLCLVLLGVVLLGACQASDGGYRTQGAGTSLNVDRASRTSSDLYGYMRVMCVDAGLSPANGSKHACPDGLSSSQYYTMLEAGFSEINAGCRAYVQFIFEDRLRDRQFKSGNSAIQAFISGILTLTGAGPKLFSYLVLSSTTANAFYDVSRVDPLESMTVPNILKIVNQRQAAFERAAASAAIKSKPQLVRLWREYQWICTPLTISSDFNVLAAASVDGTRVDFDADARRTVNSIMGTIARVRQFDVERSLESGTEHTPIVGAQGRAEKALNKEAVTQLQSLLCTKADGGFGPNTRAAIDEWRRGISGGPLTDADLKEGLSARDISYLLQQEETCGSLGFKSAFERGYLYDDPALQPDATPESINQSRAQKLATISQKLGVTLAEGATKINPVLRTAIREKRKEFRMSDTNSIDFAFLRELFEKGS